MVKHCDGNWKVNKTAIVHSKNDNQAIKLYINCTLIIESDC